MRGVRVRGCEDVSVSRPHIMPLGGTGQQLPCEVLRVRHVWEAILQRTIRGGAVWEA